MNDNQNADLVNTIRQLNQRIDDLESRLAVSQARVTELQNHWETWLRLISHDLRGPLTLMIGYTQNVLPSLPNQMTQERHELTAAVGAGQRLDKMIGEIVDAARLEAGLIVLNVTTVDIAAILRHQIQKARRRYPGRSIRASIPERLPLIRTDAKRTGQIFLDLLSNAILFSSSEATVSVSVKHAARQVIIGVSDQGIGLTEGEKAQLFESFYRPERARDVRREGLGLSLMVSEQIARLLDGRLWVESDGANQGATFYVAFPVATTQASEE